MYLFSENSEEIPLYLDSLYSTYLYWNFKIENGYCQEKPNWCPLKELPDETHNDVYMDEYCDGYDDGWNSLRKEILGEDEENK